MTVTAQGHVTVHINKTDGQDAVISYFGANNTENPETLEKPYPQDFLQDNLNKLYFELIDLEKLLSCHFSKIKTDQPKYQ